MDGTPTRTCGAELREPSCLSRSIFTGPIMNEPAPPPFPDDATASKMSLGARLLNVFAAPGDVFEEVRAAQPAAANWLVPVLVSCVAGVAAVFVMFSQPAVMQQMREKQEQQLDKLVASGKMNAEDKQRAEAGIERLGTTLIKVSGSVGAVVGNFAWLLIAALVLKLFGRLAFQAPIAYPKALEIAGLAAMISVLGGIVQMLLVLVTGSLFVSLGPALLIQDFDAANKMHLALASVNIMTLWYLGVLAVGLAKLSRGGFAKAALWLFSLWGAFRVVAIFAGLAASGM